MEEVPDFSVNFTLIHEATPGSTGSYVEYSEGPGGSGSSFP